MFKVTENNSLFLNFNSELCFTQSQDGCMDLYFWDLSIIYLMQCDHIWPVNAGVIKEI